MAKPTLDSYISKSVAEADSLNPRLSRNGPLGIRAKVEDPVDRGSDYDPANAWKLNPRQTAGYEAGRHWCLRSLAEIGLAGGIHVRRVALFNQPLGYVKSENQRDRALVWQEIWAIRAGMGALG